MSDSDFDDEIDYDNSTFTPEIIYNHKETIEDSKRELYNDFEEEENEEEKEVEEKEESPKKFILKPKQPLRFLKGITKNGLPFFGFDPVDVSDIR